MSKTRTELVNRALEKLLVVGAGQTADSEDVAKVDDIVDSVLEALSTDGFYTVSDTAEIDEAPFEWIAEVLAVASMPDFGQPMDIRRREYAEWRLQRLTASRPTYQPMKAEHF